MKILNLNLRNKKILKIFIGLILLTSIVVIPIIVSKQYSNGTMNVNQNNNKNLKNNNDLHIDFLTRIKKLEDQLNSKIDWYENKIKEDAITFELIKKSQPSESELH